MVKSVKSGSYYYSDWYSTFNLPKLQVTSLKISYTGKYNTFRSQNLYLYNFSASAWQKIDTRVIGPSIYSFDLPVAAPAGYVSSGGQLRVRFYSYSTVAFTGYTDYLKINVTLGDAPAPTPTLTPTPTPAPAPTTSGPKGVSGDYSSTGATLLRGQITSGSFASLNSKDGAFLTVRSAVSGSYYFTDWYSTFVLPNRQVSSLSLSFTGKYSAFEGQTLYLYNFSTSAWQKIDYRTVGASIYSYNLPVTGPASYVSAAGQVRVRLYSYSRAAFTGYTDYLKLTVKY